jgi:hypothetical protein
MNCLNIIDNYAGIKNVTGYVLILYNMGRVVYTTDYLMNDVVYAYYSTTDYLMNYLRDLTTVSLILFVYVATHVRDGMVRGVTMLGDVTSQVGDGIARGVCGGYEYMVVEYEYTLDVSCEILNVLVSIVQTFHLPIIIVLVIMIVVLIKTIMSVQRELEVVSARSKTYAQRLNNKPTIPITLFDISRVLEKDERSARKITIIKKIVEDYQVGKRYEF